MYSNLNYRGYENEFDELIIKYKEALEIYNIMTSNVPQEQPHCDEIYAKSSLWALNESGMDIEKEMKVYLTTRIDEEDYFIYHIMETRFNVHLPKKNMMKNKSIDNNKKMRFQ
jgi:hypothetical protein